MSEVFPQSKSALELAEKHPEQFLTDEVFPEHHVHEFKFSKKGGKLGTNMISEHVVMPAHAHPGGLKPEGEENELAIHLNCAVKAFRINTISIRVESFHLTIRSLRTQTLIDKHGPSVMAVENSIQLGVNTEWKTRSENLKDLAQEIGINEDQTLFEVTKKQDYNDAYMKGLIKNFKAKVEGRIHHLLGGVAVHWEGDKSFP